jgi:hypothetical protein
MICLSSEFLNFWPPTGSSQLPWCSLSRQAAAVHRLASEPHREQVSALRCEAGLSLEWLCLWRSKSARSHSRRPRNAAVAALLRWQQQLQLLQLLPCIFMGWMVSTATVMFLCGRTVRCKSRTENVRVILKRRCTRMDFWIFETDSQSH